MDDSKSLYRKWLFHQTSIYKWLFGVPGIDILKKCRLFYMYPLSRWFDSWPFGSPNVGGHQQPTSTGHKKSSHKGYQQNCQVHILLIFKNSKQPPWMFSKTLRRIRFQLPTSPQLVSRVSSINRIFIDFPLLLMDKILHHQGWWLSHYL